MSTRAVDVELICCIDVNREELGGCSIGAHANRQSLLETEEKRSCLREIWDITKIWEIWQCGADVFHDMYVYVCRRMYHLHKQDTTSVKIHVHVLQLMDVSKEYLINYQYIVPCKTERRALLVESSIHVEEVVGFERAAK